MDRARPSFFILGCPRSGTTLLRRMLCASGEVAIPPETSFYEWERTKRDPGRPLSTTETLAMPWQLGSSGLPGRFIRGKAMRAKLRDLNLNWRDLARDFRHTDRLPVRVLELIMGQWTRCLPSPPRIVGEKSPNHAFHVKTIRANQPEALIVHLIRDPRACVSSMLRVPFRNDTAESAARHWVQSIERARLASNDRYMEMFYEPLVDEPETSLRTLCHFIGASFDDAMLAHDRSKHAVPGSNDDRHKDWMSRSATALTHSRVEAWRDELTDEQISTVERIAGDLMDEFGYQRQYAHS